MKNILIIGSLIAALIAGCSSLPQPNFEPSEPSFRVVTYNINWGMPGSHQVANFLLESEADLICLQETHSRWETFLKSHLAAAYPHSFFHSSGGAGGIAFMSKQPLNNIRILQATNCWFPAIIADVTTELGSVQVLNVHLKPPLSDTGSATASAYYESPDVHRKELAGFLKNADTNSPLIIAGDFNENERHDAIRELLNNGFCDALSLFDTGSKTWSWKVFPGFTLSNRYDHIIFSKHFHCTGAQVVDIGASDHRPVLAVFTHNKVLTE